MLLPEQGIRQRKNRSLNEIVQDFDTFTKVDSKVQETRSVGNGICTFFFNFDFIFNFTDSICCFILIAVLCFGEIYEYWWEDSVSYKFGVDTDYDE
jgi:hypothetical protein